jgi:hypothetical protein
MVMRGNARCVGCPGRPADDVHSGENLDETSGTLDRYRGGDRSTELARRRDRSGGETSLDVGRFGAISNVTVPDNEAALLSELGNGVQVLLNLANTLSRSKGHTEISRKVIRECRTLATLIQEELETRRGP